MDSHVKVVGKDKVSYNTSRLSFRFTPLNSFAYSSMLKGL
jgi:hypothetical protein